jgi:hypothetical protein
MLLEGRLTVKTTVNGENMNPSTLVQKLSGKEAWCLILFVLAAFVGGCASYEPVPVPASYGPSYDRVWESALGAAQDAGVRIFSSDRTTGRIQGIADSTDVTISVMRQADGNIRVEFNTRGPKGEDADLNQRLTSFYNRRMGR